MKRYFGVEKARSMREAEFSILKSAGYFIPQSAQKGITCRGCLSVRVGSAFLGFVSKAVHGWGDPTGRRTQRRH